MGCKCRYHNKSSVDLKMSFAKGFSISSVLFDSHWPVKLPYNRFLQMFSTPIHYEQHSDIETSLDQGYPGIRTAFGNTSGSKKVLDMCTLMCIMPVFKLQHASCGTTVSRPPGICSSAPTSKGRSDMSKSGDDSGVEQMLCMKKGPNSIPGAFI